MSRFVRGVNGVLTVVVLAAAAAAALALGGGQDPRLDVLAHFAPLYGALGLAGAVWALVAGAGPSWSPRWWPWRPRGPGAARFNRDAGRSWRHRAGPAEGHPDQ